MHINIRVPTRLILFGEHFVLHGGDALSIPLREHEFELEIKKLQGSKWTAQPDSSHEMLKKDLDFLKKEGLLPNFGAALNWKCDLPAGAGAGLSAAWTVALLRGLFPDMEQKECEALLQKMENRHHGQASGLDHLSIYHDAPVFISGGKVEILDAKLMDLPIWKNLSWFLSGIPNESTLEMIEFAKKQKLEKALSVLPKGTEALKYIEENQIENLINFINEYGRALESFGLVDEKTREILEDYRSKGYGAKICGAGGLSGGSGMCLLLKR